ncbi:hypothetical protein [Corynebacterium alimapuense]|uniref:restriction endonuclease n=1 Tax=Corynebacterium alimapuense TaxID=1576874 RepID=UPI000F80EEFB|nr:hypothetical protein [Corynebacterium alimapuense]
MINDDGTVDTRSETRSTYDSTEAIPYGEWLQLAYEQTFLPPDRIHTGLVAADKKKKLPKNFFDKATLGNFVTGFQVWMQREMISRFSYTKIEGLAGATALTDDQGQPLKRIIQGNIGVYRDEESRVPEKFLYDVLAYDSPKEKQTIRDSHLDQVVVFGKIPRRSIPVPLYFGGAISPDFMYVLKDKDGKLSLNFIVETKDVEEITDLRESEQMWLEASRKFFESVDKEKIKVTFRPQLKSDDIVTMIRQVVDADN